MAADFHEAPVTKVLIPVTNTVSITRPRLFERLRQALDCPLTLICAPAGAGKTTLITGWHTASDEAAFRLTWVSIDEDDNEPEHLAAAIALALNAVQPGILDNMLALLGSAATPDAHAVARLIVNQMAAASDRCVLVLDDYHRVTNPLAHEIIAHLVERMPPDMHLIISTRQDPPLPLGRLRVRDQIVEIREQDLRFGQDETERFLRNVFGITLTAAQAAALEQRVEGWAAGLKMAALALRGRSDIAAFIEAFTGSHRYVVDYLMEEVIARQPPELHAFLTQTSVLREMSASLCEAVTGDDNAQVVLEQLVHLNLFTIPLDDENRWFRYHHLFADVLQSHLKQQGAARWTAVHQKAAAWYERAGDIQKAVYHYVQANDHAGAAGCLDTLTVKDIERVGALQFLRWIDTLPESVLMAFPNLLVSAAYADTAMQHDAHTASTAYVPLARAALDRYRGSQDIREHLEARLAVIESRQILSRLGDVERCLELMNFALPRLEQDAAWRGLALLHLAKVHIALDDMESARQTLEHTIHLAQGRDDLPVLLRAAHDLGLILLRETKVAAANHYFQLALRAAERQGEADHPMMSAVYMGAYYGAAHRADGDEALAYLDRVIQLASRVEHVAHLAQAMIWQGYAYFHRGDHEAARASIERYDDLLRQYPDIVDWRLLGQRAALNLELGNYEAARQWALDSGLSFDMEANALNQRHSATMALSSLIVLCVVGLAALARGEPFATWEQIVNLLEWLHERARQHRQIAWQLNVLVNLAVAYSMRGDNETAFDFLEDAFSLAEEEGYIAVFVYFAALPVLEAYHRSRRPTPVSQRALAACRRAAGAAAPQTRGAKEAAYGDLEPLSVRELEVLRLVERGCSNIEIAQQLYLSLGTVKRHLANIFIKLGADSRTHALAIAREHDII